MLKGIDPLLNPDVLWALASMGHGDDLVIVDKNFPADSVARDTKLGRPLRMDGRPMAEVVEIVTGLMPIDAYVDDPLRAMAVVDRSDALPAVQQAVTRIVRQAAAGLSIELRQLERHTFYRHAREAYAVISTSDPVAYGCFLIRKGVINDGLVEADGP